MMNSRDDGRMVRNIRGIVVALLMIGCVVVVWPFITAILWAVVLTFTTWPIYRRVLVRLGGRPTWAALVMTLGMLVILVGPFVIVGFTLSDEVKDLAAATRNWM